MQRIISTLILAALVACGTAAAAEAFPLWSGDAPHAAGAAEKSTPTLQPYLPEPRTATGAAVVVFPGGGYGHLAKDHEGVQIGRWLSQSGVAAFVTHYRHAPEYHHPVPLEDAQRAIRTVRARAKEWKVDPDRIGVLGFSAGGHLAATTGTLFDGGKPEADDKIDQASCRPDFMILLYPVIAMAKPYGHMGSRRNLLGPEPADELVKKMSPELQVTGHTPPAFLVHTSTDTVVPSQNSVLFYMALRKAGVPAEMHIFEQGPHGFGLGRQDAALTVWSELCLTWLRTRGILPPLE